jgi:hypothetical protein
MATKYRKGHELFHLLLFLFRTVLIRQAAMVHKYHWLYFFIPSIFLASAQHQNIYIPNFCYNDRYKGRNQSFWILRIYVYNRERYEKQESFIILDFQHKNCACTKSQGRPWSIPVNKWEFVWACASKMSTQLRGYTQRVFAKRHNCVNIAKYLVQNRWLFYVENGDDINLIIQNFLVTFYFTVATLLSKHFECLHDNTGNSCIL